MNMFYNNYFWGMYPIWWLLWIVVLFWIFATPYYIPGQRRRKDPPLRILQKEFASGLHTKEEYQEKKNILERGTNGKG
jgi:putative membrane protein